MRRLSRSHGIAVGVLFLLASAVTVLTLAQDGSPGGPAKPKDIFTEVHKFTEIFQYIRKMYFRPVDENVLLGGAIEGLLQTVDRNNGFVPDTRELLSSDDPEASQKTGAGIILGFTSLENFGDSVPVILAVIPGSAADKAGLRPKSVLWQVGDRIVVNGELLARNLYQLLDAPSSGKAELVVFDPVDGRREVSLSPASMKLSSKLESEELASGGLHVKFPIYVDGSAVSELEQLIAKRGEALAKGMVLDLRSTCLGDPELGYRLADLFIRDGAQLGKVLVEKADGKFAPKKGVKGEELLFRADDKKALLDFPLVVLVDFTTAGPAELLSGALKHAGRAKVVGARTFGYAVFRERFVFEEGTQITLTTGLLTTGADKVYIGEGLEPDVKVEEKDEAQTVAHAIESEVEAEGDETAVAAATPKVAAEPTKAPDAPKVDRFLDAAAKELTKLTEHSAG